MSSDSSSASLQQQFDALASKRQRDASRHKTYYQDRLRLLQLIPEDASIVDVGCGIGTTLSQLPQKKKMGIDFSAEMIRLAKENDDSSQYIQSHIEELDKKDTYDYVLLLDSVNYFHDVQKAFESIRAHLCHDHSRILITYYNVMWQPIILFAQWIGWKTVFPEQNWFNGRDIDNLLSLTDYEPVVHGARVLCPFSIPFISHLLNTYVVHLPFFRYFAFMKYVIARPKVHQQKDYSVTVLSAMRNERGNVRPIVDAMPTMGSKTEILFIEGHSSDGTWEEIQEVESTYNGPLSIRGIKQTGTGKANALHEGMAASTGDIIFIYDGDFTVHPSELSKLYDALQQGHAEFVNASRLVYPLQEGAMRLLNLFGNKFFSLLFSWLFQQQLGDVLSPVKGMFSRHYPAVKTRMDPFGDFDFFLGAATLHLKMREIPVRYLERTYGTTKIRRFHHGWLLFKMCMKGARILRFR